MHDINSPLHPSHHASETTRSATIEYLDSDQACLRSHPNVEIIWCSSPCGCTAAVRAVSVVIIRENLTTIGFVGIRNYIIECDDFGVIGSGVIIEVVQT